MSLRNRLILAISSVLVLVIIALEVPLAISYTDRIRSEARSQLSSQASVVAASTSDLLAPLQRQSLDQTVRASARSTQGRVSILDSDGRILASSQPFEAGESFASNAEVKSVLDGIGFQRGNASQSTRQDVYAAAAPIIHEGSLVGVAQITLKADSVNSEIRSTLLVFILIGLLVLLIGSFAGVLIARQFARPMRALNTAARRVSGGDLSTSVVEQGSQEERSLARSFNEMTRRIDRLLHSQQQFVADASHQLRTPLTGLRLRIEEVQASGVDDLAAADLAAATSELDRLSAIITDLLLLSRAGESELTGELLSPADVVSRLASRWQPAALAANKNLETIIASPSETTFCGEPDLSKALDVLVENAIIYTPGGGKITVELDGNKISVIDDGPGLNEGENEQVFERFFRGKASQGGQIKGTGLGLPIARELMRRWKGDVKIANDSTRGARATVTLPPPDQA